MSPRVSLWGCLQVQFCSLMPLESVIQAAGHDGCEVSGAVFIKSTTEQEVQFYRDALVGDSQLDGTILLHWMPVMMGTLTPGNLHGIEGAEKPVLGLDVTDHINSSVSNEKVKIVLQNLYHGFSHPSILDIKLGKVLTDNTVTPEKAHRLAKVSSTTTSGSLGFRICGMKLWGKDVEELPQIYPNMKDHITNDNDYLSFDKFFGRSLTDSTMEQAMHVFFSAIPAKHRLKVINRFHQRLQLLYNCLLDAEVRIFSGSLLFIYESDPHRWTLVENYDEADPLLYGLPDDSDEEDTSEQNDAPLSKLNMIDFAHATHTKGKGYDENIVDAVENLIDLFDRILQ